MMKPFNAFYFGILLLLPLLSHASGPVKERSLSDLPNLTTLQVIEKVYIIGPDYGDPVIVENANARCAAKFKSYFSVGVDWSPGRKIVTGAVGQGESSHNKYLIEVVDGSEAVKEIHCRSKNSNSELTIGDFIDLVSSKFKVILPETDL